MYRGIVYLLNNPRNKFIISLPCLYSIAHIEYSDSGVLILTPTNSNQKIIDEKRLLVYVFVILHFYEAILEILTDPNIDFMNSPCLRWIFYLLKRMLITMSSITYDLFIDYIGLIFMLLQIYVTSYLFMVIRRDGQCDIVGDVKIIDEKDPSKIDYVSEDY